MKIVQESDYIEQNNMTSTLIILKIVYIVYCLLTRLIEYLKLNIRSIHFNMLNLPQLIKILCKTHLFYDYWIICDMSPSNKIVCNSQI